LFVVNLYLIVPAFLADTEIKPESQQAKAYELRVYENISLKTGSPQAIMGVSSIEESSFDCEMHVGFNGIKVLDMVL
jgi:lysozyme family protein